MEVKSALYPNSNMPFLINEFSKNFEDFFTMAFYPEMTHLYDQTKNLKITAQDLRLTLLTFHESFPTVSGLI